MNEKINLPEDEKKRLDDLSKKGEIKYLEASVIDIDDGKKIAIASQETLDRQGEIIALDGWDLKNFKRNPVMLWSHNPYEPNVGAAKSVGFRDVNGKKSLVFEPDFHGLTALSATLKQLYEEGYLRAFSVGFLPSEMDGNKFTKQELLEISSVNVPAHPNALNVAYAKGMTKEDAKLIFSNEKSEEKEEEKKEKEEEKDEFVTKKEFDEYKNSVEKKLEALPTSGREEKAYNDSDRRLLKVIDRCTEKLLRKNK